ncbi:MAG TPA: DMT family transporter [Cellvibrio sp.]|nr:DMT family transporter [Cellvibrio sp.]
MNPRVSVWLMVIASTFFWGSNFNAGHAIADDVAPLTAAADRFGVALILFLLLRLMQGKAESQLQWKDGLVLVPLGVVGVFGFNYAFFTALHTTSALNAALIMALSPMLSLIFSVWLLNTRIKGYQYLGIALAFVGVSLVITGGNFGLLHIVPGDAWMLGACVVWSLYSVAAKKFAAHVPSLQLARWTVSIGAVALITAACLLEQPVSSIPQLSLQTHAILFYMSICGTVLAYIFWLRGVHFLGPDKSAIAFNLVPVFTLLVSLALGSLPNLIQIAGMVLVLIGVVTSSGWRPKKTPFNPTAKQAD